MDFSESMRNTIRSPDRLSITTIRGMPTSWNTKDQLKAAPAGSIEELTRSDGASYRDRVFDYYNEPRYW